MPVYHVDVFLPKRVRGLVPKGVKQITYAKHALDAAKNDRFGEVTKLPNSLDFSQSPLIEVLTSGKKADKIVIRTPIDDERDLCLALIPTCDSKIWFAKTVWVNLRSDKHSTLRSNEYAKQ